MPTTIEVTRDPDQLTREMNEFHTLLLAASVTPKWSTKYTPQTVYALEARGYSRPRELVINGNRTELDLTVAHELLQAAKLELSACMTACDIHIDASKLEL